MNPGQLVADLRIEVHINESLPVSRLEVPELLESNELVAAVAGDSRLAVVERAVGGEPRNARVVIAPSKEKQQAAGEQGLAGRYLVRYDVDRAGRENEVQVIDGYFVHYFVPENLPTLPKHAIFVLDVSGSMFGEKLQQLKDAMFTVLDDMVKNEKIKQMIF